jgi:hypothetical protein
MNHFSKVWYLFFICPFLSIFCWKSNNILHHKVNSPYLYIIAWNLNEYTSLVFIRRCNIKWPSPVFLMRLQVAYLASVRKVQRYHRINQKPKSIWTNVAMAKRKKAKMTNNDLQYTTQKTNDRVARIPLKPGWTQVLRKGLQFLPSLVTAVVLLLLQTRRWVINEGM